MCLIRLGYILLELPHVLGHHAYENYFLIGVDKPHLTQSQAIIIVKFPGYRSS